MAEPTSRSAREARIMCIIFCVVLLPLAVLRLFRLPLWGLPASLLWLGLCIPLVTVLLLVLMDRTGRGARP